MLIILTSPDLSFILGITTFKAFATFILTLATGSLDIGIKIGVTAFDKASGDSKVPTCLSIVKNFIVYYI